MKTTRSLYTLLLALAAGFTLCGARAEPVGQQWLFREPDRYGQNSGAISVAVDAAGDVIATGAMSNNFPAVTAKFSGASGAKLWEATMSGDSFPREMVLDGAGNAIVAGGTRFIGDDTPFVRIEKYASADGSRAWSVVLSQRAVLGGVAVDSAGNVFVAGNIGVNFVVKKLAAADGSELWQAVETQGHGGQAHAVAVTPDGDVVATGAIRNGGGRSLKHVVKLSGSTGASLWSVTDPFGSTEGLAVKVDALGNVAIAGVIYGSAQQAYLARYDGDDGSLIWEKFLGPVFSRALDVDAAGNLFTTSGVLYLNDQGDSRTALYNAKYAAADGVVLWEREYRGPAGDDHTFASGLGVRVGPGGHVFVGANQTEIISLEQGIGRLYTAKLDGATGTVRWEQLYDGPEGFGATTATPHSLAPTSDGGVAVATGTLDYLSPDTPITYFTVLQYGTPRVTTPTNFTIDDADPGEAWTFTATLGSNEPGLFLRVQSTLTPGDEASWADLFGGGQMTRSGNTWTLATSDLPLGTRFFRVIAAATDYLDSKAQAAGSYFIISPAGRILYTRGSLGASELVLMQPDGSEKLVLTDSNYSPLACALSRDGMLAAFTTADGELFVMKAEPIHATENVPVNVIDGADVTASIESTFAWAPDGKRIVFHGSDSHLQVIEVLDEAGEITPWELSSNPLIDAGESLASAPNPAWSPDGKYLALAGANYVIAFQITDGTGAITPHGAGNPTVALTDANDFSGAMRSVAWAPDGRRLAIVERATAGGTSQVSLLSARDALGALTPEGAGNPITPLHAMTSAPETATVSWSPDGSLLAIGGATASGHHVEVFKPAAIDAANPRRVLTTQAEDGDAFQPSFKQPAGALALTQTFSFEASDYLGNEDDPAIAVRVTRTGGTSGTASVPFSVTGGTATLGADFTIAASPLVFADGETVKTIVLTPVQDSSTESDETVLLALGTPDVGELGAITAATVLIDDSAVNSPFAPPAVELTATIKGGKPVKKGKAKTGDLWKFTVRQSQGNLLEGLEVRVQATTTPADAGSWVTLPEGALHRANLTSQTWVGSTRRIPTGKVYFRTRTYAVGHRSNAGPVIGPFKVAAAPVLDMTLRAVTKSDGGAVTDPTGLSAKPGEFITYTLEIENTGAAPATAVVINSRIPPRTRFDSASNAGAGGTFRQDLDRKGLLTDVFWNVGTLLPTMKVTEFVTVQVDQTAPLDWIIQNDRATYKAKGIKETFLPIFRTDVAAPIRITVAKDKSIVRAGDEITYTLTIHNDSGDTYTGGKVTDQVPAGTRLTSIAYGSGDGNYLGVDIAADTLTAAPIALQEPGFTPHNATLTWNVGNIPAGGSRQLRFKARVNYDLFTKLAREGQSFDVVIQNLNFDFTATPPSGGIVAARGGVIPGADIARTFVSAELPDTRPQLGLKKEAMSDTWTRNGNDEIAAVFHNGARVIEYEIAAWNYGNATAEDTIIYEAIPADTELSSEKVVTGVAATDTFTTARPHGFAVNEKVLFPYLNGGKGLTPGKIYFVQSAPDATSFTVAASLGGAPVNFTTDLEVGAVRRFAYDFPGFMEQFAINGVVQNFPNGFRFYDKDGNELSAGGEPFIDHNGNGKVDRGEFIDQNTSGKYDGPGAIRGFTFALGDLAPMTAPAETTLSYRVRLNAAVKRGAFIGSVNAATHVRGQGLALTTPDFFYPLNGSPDLVLTKVVGPVVFNGDAADGPQTKVVLNNPVTHERTYRISFANEGDFFAIGTQLRVPLPPGFTTDSAPIQKANGKDVKLPGTPGTAVFDIGTVAPGERVVRDLELRLVSGTAPALFLKNGLLKDYSAPILPTVTATGYSAGAPAAPLAARSLLATQNVTAPVIPDAGFTSTFNAAETNVQKDPNAFSTCVFVGRIAPASVQAGTEFDMFIFCGNIGGKLSGAGEVGIQIPYGTRFVSANPIASNPDGVSGVAGLSTTLEFPNGFIKQEPVFGKRLRPQDGTVEVIRWKFANISPSQLFAFKLRLFVTSDFPGTQLTDRSCYIKCDDAKGKAAAPLSIYVRKDTNGTTDAWQTIGNFLDGVGSTLNGALRSLFGGQSGQVHLGSHVVGIGGADFIQLTNGRIIIPLGKPSFSTIGRSAIIAEAVVLASSVPRDSIVFESGNTLGSLCLAAGATNAQEVFVPGATDDFRGVNTVLSQLDDPVNSIVAGGGGNIVAAGGGNVVANDGAGIVANFKPGSVARVVSNDGAGLLPGSITFTDLNRPGIVAGGGGNIVAAGGGNIVAAGAGNIVAGGGGNIVAGGGGNIVAAGGGNLVSAGLGNSTVIDGLRIDADKLRDAVAKLIGNDGAGLLNKKLLNELIGDGGGTLIGDGGGTLIGNDAGSLRFDQEALSNLDPNTLNNQNREIIGDGGGT